MNGLFHQDLSGEYQYIGVSYQQSITQGLVDVWNWGNVRTCNPTRCCFKVRICAMRVTVGTFKGNRIVGEVICLVQLLRQH